MSKYIPDEPHLRANILYLATFILCLPALWAGYMGDDYIHHALLSTHLPIEKPDDLSLFGLFSFINGDSVRNRLLMDYSLIPWWTYSDLKYAFWRPLSEISHWIDHRLWPNQPWLMHLHNLIWYLAALVLLRRLYIRIIPASSAVLMALAVFALDSSHGFAVSWIANRNAMISLTISLVTLIYFIKWREEGSKAALIISLTAMLLGMLSAEASVSILGYGGAYALVLDRKGPLKGLLATLPWLLLMIVWWVIYKDAGFGASNASAYYVDPAAQPLTYIAKALERMPVVLASQWGIIPAEIYGFAGRTLWGYVAGCAFFLLLILIPVLRTLSVSRTTWFWMLGMLFATLPVLSALPHDRLLFFTGIGASALIGMFLQRVFRAGNTKEDSEIGRYTKAVAYVLVALHLVLSPLLLPVMSYSSKLLWSNMISHKPSFFDGIENLTDKQLVLFSPPLASDVIIALLRFYRQDPLPERLWTISTLNEPFALHVLDEHTVEIVRPEGFIDREELSFRDLKIQPFSEGEKVLLSGLSIETRDINDEGKPTRLLLHFDRALDNPNLVFLQWNREQEHYQPLIPVKPPTALPALEQ